MVILLAFTHGEWEAWWFEGVGTSGTGGIFFCEVGVPERRRNSATWDGLGHGTLGTGMFGTGKPEAGKWVWRRARVSLPEVIR